MKKLHGLVKTLVVSAVAVVALVGCPDNNNRNRNDYYDNYYGYYPYNAPRYMLMREDQQGNTEYMAMNEPINNQQEVSRYHNSRFQRLNNNKVIDRQQGYKRVKDQGIYFVEHDEQQYKNPHRNPRGQSSYWWNTYSYACSYQTGYWYYNSYCNYNWNHIYAPYNYSWYNNWYLRPTYYYNNSFWYFAQGWQNYYWYQGYYYYYFWIP